MCSVSDWLAAGISACVEIEPNRRQKSSQVQQGDRVEIAALDHAHSGLAHSGRPPDGRLTQSSFQARAVQFLAQRPHHGRRPAGGNVDEALGR